MEIDLNYLCRILKDLLAIPSPSGRTDEIVGYMREELEALGIDYELTRKGAIRANLDGRRSQPDRAIASHVDTLGAMVKGLKPNNRLQVAPIGTWSSRFAEGARVSVYSAHGPVHRGTLLPLKASGHTFNKEIDTQPVSWNQLECRLDFRFDQGQTLADTGIEVGDHIAIDTQAEFNVNGFVSSRHLDDKAGVASVMAAAKSIVDDGVVLPVDCHLLFTISEEVGVGASHVLSGDVAEMVSVDNGTVAPGQNTCEYGVTIAMMDSSGPFDWHLNRHMLDLCAQYGIEHSRDVFNYYRSDAAAAEAAGNDIRTALVCFGLDASHGHERIHVQSLHELARLLRAYMESPPLFERDETALGPVGDLPLEPGPELPGGTPSVPGHESDLSLGDGAGREGEDGP